MKFTMFQDVTIPADAPQATLSWQDRVQWNFNLGGPATEPREYAVEILDPVTGDLLETVYSFSTGTQAENPTGDTGWASRSSDLSDYVGQTVRLNFVESVPQPTRGPGQIEFDAISVETGGGPSNVDDVIERFVAPGEGTYYVRVNGDEGTDYSLVATRSAEFDLEDNNDFASAQPIASSTFGGRQYVLGHVGSSESETTTITFDELPSQPANGVSLEGVTFDFTINGAPSSSARFGGNGPGTTTHTDDPGIVGPTRGVLGLTFDQPVGELRFGIALSITTPVPEAASVRLLDENSMEIRVFNVAAEPGDFLFTSGLFVYDGSTPVSRAEVSYNSAVAGSAVAQDCRLPTSAAGRCLPGPL